VVSVLSIAESRGKRPGFLVRVKREVEELVREVAEYKGYSSDTIRNTAILWGLLVILGGEGVRGTIPETSEEFLKLYRVVKSAFELVKEMSSRPPSGEHKVYVKRMPKKGEA
jgi:hypothetical protein